MIIIEPVITRPLIREWEAVKASIVAIFEPAGLALEEAVKSAIGYPKPAEEVRTVQGRLVERPQLELFDRLGKQRRVRAVDSVPTGLRSASRSFDAAEAEGKGAYDTFMARLRAFRVLDPACGSGNFL